eukprot:COSAG06_NODE_28_length_32009_cov_31.553463_12_plen_104_part_00
MTLPIRVTWTAPMPTSAGMKRKTIYVLADEDRVIRYLGSTDLPCEERFKLHKLQASSDGSASPCIDTLMQMEDLTDGQFSLYAWSTTIRRYYPTQPSTKKTFV